MGLLKHIPIIDKYTLIVHLSPVWLFEEFDVFQARKLTFLLQMACIYPIENSEWVGK